MHCLLESRMVTAVEATAQRGVGVAGPQSRRSVKKLAAWLGGVVVIAAAAIGGVRYWTYGRFIESTDDAYVQADSTVIAPKVSGYVAAVMVQDNQRVRAGQTLALIDDRDYRAAFAQAQSDVQIATRHARRDSRAG
jgi:membrane fusion protein (multidrug efflux system)